LLRSALEFSWEPIAAVAPHRKPALDQGLARLTASGLAFQPRPAVGAQGKRAEVRGLLAPVYDWFTEGFDTADLRRAKTLIDRLT
jgi:hypothetical protein